MHAMIMFFELYVMQHGRGRYTWGRRETSLSSETPPPDTPLPQHPPESSNTPSRLATLE